MEVLQDASPIYLQEYRLAVEHEVVRRDGLCPSLLSGVRAWLSVSVMRTLAEIEDAIMALPPEEQQALLALLSGRLRQSAPADTGRTLNSEKYTWRAPEL
jgi:hypothetical protein